MAQLDVSLVLAVYNEEECLALELKTVIDVMSKSGLTYEIIVIDDCSTDKSREILRNTKGITLVEHTTNVGAGGTRKEGIGLAKGQIIVWTDMDLTYPNELIPAMVHQLRSGNDRQITTRRIIKDHPPLLRECVKFVLRAFASLLCGTWIRDLNTGMRAFYREDVMTFIDLIPQGFSCCSTMTMMSIYRGFKVGYMDIEYKKRAGASKFHPIFDTYKCFAQVLRLALKNLQYGHPKDKK